MFNSVAQKTTSINSSRFEYNCRLKTISKLKPRIEINPNLFISSGFPDKNLYTIRRFREL